MAKNSPLRKIKTEVSVRQLKKQNEQLLALNRSKDEFVAIASHQLRTPATAVKQYLALLLEGYADPLSESQKVFIEKAFESNERQLRIVDDILRVTQLDLDKIRMSPSHCDLGEVVDTALAAVQGATDRRKQKIVIQKPEEPLIANVDRNLIRMVVENILENASNYSYADSPISVSIQEVGNEAQIRISDRGVGISQEDIPKLFQKFSRIPNPLSVESGGTGLGLYWAQKLVALHGGKILVSSVPDKGSSFIICLPL